jgi:hypothetical protein
LEIEIARQGADQTDVLQRFEDAQGSASKGETGWEFKR